MGTAKYSTACDRDAAEHDDGDTASKFADMFRTGCGANISTKTMSTQKKTAAKKDAKVAGQPSNGPSVSDLCVKAACTHRND